MPTIHPTAIVSPETVIGKGVEIGPFCVLSGRVTLGPDVRLIAHVCINGPVEIGARTQLFPGTCLGYPGQDYKFKIGDPTAGVVVGSDCLLREGVTIHAATRQDRPTRVGDRVFMMAAAHVGHDGQVGNNVIMVNQSLVAGHGQVFDSVTMAGHTALHQYNRIGRLAFISGQSGFSTDVPPFCIGVDRNQIAGINLIGMRRNGIPRDDITKVREAYRLAFRRGLQRSEILAILEALGRECAPVMEMAEFVRTAKRTIAPVRIVRERGEVEGAGT